MGISLNLSLQSQINSSDQQTIQKISIFKPELYFPLDCPLEVILARNGFDFTALIRRAEKEDPANPVDPVKLLSIKSNPFHIERKANDSV